MRNLQQLETTTISRGTVAGAGEPLQLAIVSGNGDCSAIARALVGSPGFDVVVTDESLGRLLAQ